MLDTGCSIAVKRLKQVPIDNSCFPWSLDIHFFCLICYPASDIIILFHWTLDVRCWTFMLHSNLMDSSGRAVACIALMVGHCCFNFGSEIEDYNE